MSTPDGSREASGPQTLSAPPASNSAASPRSASLTAADLQAAYTLGQQHESELTQELLLEQPVVVGIGVIWRAGLCCLLRPSNVIGKLKTLDAFDYKVYCAIEQAGTTGVWTADLRKSTGLQTHIIQRSVKQLCDFLKLIKPVKSIHVKNRKMYILAHLEPAKEIAGGSFYSNGEFNEHLVEHLREQTRTFLQNAGTASFQALAAYTRSSGERNGATFSDEDLEKVLNSLEFEQKICRVPTLGQPTFVWSKFPALYDPSGLPCSTCPVKSSCYSREENKISPANCEYLSSWLGLDFEVDATSEAEEASAADP
ncbi:putative DNA-directed RNA polymerases III, 39 kDa polypeptide [Neospora caninum Liverpool]|uniref:Putative DNA-directed RNA polymerases III, 39 kDa polypeptide n=1 Tax=Neospora caninum (strain Liverpool) TaxID=572307 RepID=F0VQ13_NEOCL|nr:putative DNA-directed RNA polymerases III, 39 kDa polypeptide [Neospora caninum Liverpool]CBZ55810.1 putative DNA-directed RNA polymerases III, 39 kDa polypeptide [Neospora caninum Liverpool]|eukprot:XP_003885836.1 putative DNA-directed RNA polymerases III, 39 kDa polypeptide [Neospora caninum Liverpool]